MQSAQQQQQQNVVVHHQSSNGSASSSSSRTSPTSQLLTLTNGHHALHRGIGGSGGSGCSAFEMEAARSTSSPGSALGDLTSSTPSTISGSACGSSIGMGHFQCLHCAAAFQSRDLLEKHELMHSPSSTQINGHGVNQVSENKIQIF